MASATARHGASPATRAQPMATRCRPVSSATTAASASTSAVGRAQPVVADTVAPKPAAATTTATHDAASSTCECSLRANAHQVMAAAVPSTRRNVGHDSCRWTHTAATLTGSRKPPRWKSTPLVAGRLIRRRRPASRQTPVTVARMPRRTSSLRVSQRTATNTAAATNNMKAPSPVTQTAPVREPSRGSGAGGVGAGGAD